MRARAGCRPTGSNFSWFPWVDRDQPGLALDESSSEPHLDERGLPRVDHGLHLLQQIHALSRLTAKLGATRVAIEQVDTRTALQALGMRLTAGIEMPNTRAASVSKRCSASVTITKTFREAVRLRKASIWSFSWPRVLLMGTRSW